MPRSAIPEPRGPLSQHTSDKLSEFDLPVESQQRGDKDVFPEDSWAAWSCLLGSFLMMFPSFGFQTAGNTYPHSSLCHNR